MATTTGQTYKASAKFIRISPYKVREVAAIIKGKHIDEARRILAFTPKAASATLSKILESAVANAEHNFSIPQDELYVKLVSADEGVTIRRFRARAQGRGYRIRKRTSHINLELERRQPVEQPRPKRGEGARSTATRTRRSTGGTAARAASGSSEEKPKTTRTTRTTRGKAAGKDKEAGD